MIKLSFLNSIFYLLVKYTVFFFILAFIGDRFKNAVINNAETSIEMIKLTVGYILYILIYEIFLVLLFCVPLYYILKIERWIYFLPLLIVFYCLEFFVYTYFYSPSDKMPGVYNAIIGILLLAIFFYQSIRLKFS